MSDDKVTASSFPNSSSNKGKGMRLGGHKAISSSNITSDWAEEAAAEAEAEEASHHNPWGTDDLMDVNADQDDCSKYTPAHVPH